MKRRRLLLVNSVSSTRRRIPTIVVKKLQVREIGAVKFETFVKIIILTTVSNFTAPISDHPPAITLVFLDLYHLLRDDAIRELTVQILAKRPRPFLTVYNYEYKSRF